jgi:hypothetical protein
METVKSCSANYCGAILLFAPGLPLRTVFIPATYLIIELGLYICSEIIKQHDGRIGVTSTVGSAGTFWFTLKLINTEIIKAINTVG